MAEHLLSSPELRAYLHRVGVRDDPLLTELRERTAALPGGTTLPVSAEQGQFLHLLVGLTGARRVLEIGTYTGYSTLCMARALPPDGTLVTCETAGRWPRIGAEFWRRAGVADRIDLRVAPAAETLRVLEPGFDLVFVDADKTGYPDYHEAALGLVRRGGLVVFDNTLFFGRVADPAATDPDTEAVRALNTALHADERVDLAVLDAADGITLARRR